MDGDSFARSTFVPQLSDREITATTSIRAKLTNLVEDTNDLNNYDTAMKQLQEYRKSLKRFKGEGGRTAQLRRECRELEASIHSAAEKKEPLEAVCQQIDALNREKNEKTAQQAFLREQIRQADAQKALRLQQENLSGFICHCSRTRSFPEMPAPFSPIRPIIEPFLGDIRRDIRRWRRCVPSRKI